MTRPLVAAAVLLACASPLRAQPVSIGRFELAIGPAWIGSASSSPRPATETQADGSPRPLFTSSSELAGATAFEARIGVRVTQRLDVEALGSYAAPQLRIRLTADSEGASDTTATELVQEFTVGGAAIWHVPHDRSATRTIPFLTAGAGYIRELHDGSTLANTGAVFDAGGGVKQVLSQRTSGRVKRIGIRADVRARVRPKTLAFDGRAHVSPMFAASLFVRF